MTKREMNRLLKAAKMLEGHAAELRALVRAAMKQPAPPPRVAIKKRAIKAKGKK